MLVITFEASAITESKVAEGTGVVVGVSVATDDVTVLEAVVVVRVDAESEAVTGAASEVLADAVLEVVILACRVILEVCVVIVDVGTEARVARAQILSAAKEEMSSLIRGWTRACNAPATCIGSHSRQ
jgi:hypothetical protein